MSSPAPHDARLGETIDLVADLNTQDDDGFGWSILSGARDPATVKVGSMLLAGNSQAIAVVRVVAVDDDGQIHFKILPAPDQQDPPPARQRSQELTRCLMGSRSTVHLIPPR